MIIPLFLLSLETQALLVGNDLFEEMFAPRLPSALLVGPTAPSAVAASVFWRKSVRYTMGSHFNWDKAGISLHFPQVNSHKNIMISVEVMRNIDDDSILPRRYRLLPTVSAAYRITASDELPAPVTVRIEHCAIHDKEGSLVFLKADDTPPYRFQPLPDGRFPLKESYGEIEMNHFCTLWIIWSILGYRLRLALFVFYERNGGATINSYKK